MDKFVVVTKPSLAKAQALDQKKQANRFAPYNASQRQVGKKRADQIVFSRRATDVSANSSPSSTSSSSRAVTKRLLSTLKDASNPLTHNVSNRPIEHVVSCATGHEVNEKAHHPSYEIARRAKLKAQEQDAATHAPDGRTRTLFGTRIYCDGYLEGATDTEVKRIVATHGGTPMRSPAGASHILTSQPLNGSKTHKHYTKKGGNKVHVVRPEWLFDSIAAGKRLAEWKYPIISNETQPSAVSVIVLND